LPDDRFRASLENPSGSDRKIRGCERTGYVLMRLTLMNGELDIEATQNDKYDFVIKVAKGEIDRHCRFVHPIFEPT
jgi:death-on-curing protein